LQDGRSFQWSSTINQCPGAVLTCHIQMAWSR
jgi:hypothetical protein